MFSELVDWKFRFVGLALFHGFSISISGPAALRFEGFKVYASRGFLVPGIERFLVAIRSLCLFGVCLF